MSSFLSTYNKERIHAQKRYILRKSSREGRDECSGELNTSDLEAEFKEVVRDTCKESTWALDWHLQALPTVFRRPVKLFFQKLSEGSRGVLMMLFILGRVFQCWILW